VTETYAPNWRDEARRDRAARAQLDIERDRARYELRATERREAASFKREQARDRAEAKAQARAARSARLSGVTRWLAGHTTDLLLAPVIAVPAVLAWSAMASFGASLYGPAGWAMPAFSEGAMWAFAGATTLSLHRHPGRPIWHLRAGIAVFAGFGAVLNFLHGLEMGGPVVGVVMALVSVAGVVAHQLVTAGPRRSRAQRDDVRIDRAAARRERRARKAALRGTTADMDSRGRARLVYSSGPARLERHFGRTRLVPVPAEQRELPAITTGSAPVPVTAPEADENAPVVPSQDDRLEVLATALERLVTALVTAPAAADEADEDAPDTVTDTASRTGDDTPTVTEIPAAPANAEDAARAGLLASIAAGKPYTVNGLVTRYRLKRREAEKLRAQHIPEATENDAADDANDEA